MISTLVFCTLCLFSAWLIWLHRPGSWAGGGDLAPWMVLVPLLILILFWQGSKQELGTKMVLSVTELRIPDGETKKDGTYFVVGPLGEKSDLVVGPYSDPNQSREAYRAEMDSLLTIKRKSGAWIYCAKREPDKPDEKRPGMQVSRDDHALTGCQPIGAEAVDLTIDRIEPPGDADQDEPGFLDTLRALVRSPKNPAIQPRRSFKLSEKPGYVSIALDEPLRLDIGQCNGAVESDALRIAPAGMFVPDRGYVVPRNIEFPQLGWGGVHPLLDRAKLSPIGASKKALCGQAQQRLAWPAGKGHERLIITSKITNIAWWIPFFMITSILWVALACREHWRDGEGRLEAALVMALQWLLSLRLITAMAGLFNDAALVPVNILFPPAVAFVALPLLAITLLRPGGLQTKRALAFLALQIPAAAMILWASFEGHSPKASLLWQSGGLLAAIFIAMLARGLSTDPAPLLGAGVARMRHLVTCVLFPRNNAWMLGVKLTAILVAGRLLLLLIGWQERALGFPISLVYAPMSILAVALLMKGYRSAPSLPHAGWLAIMFGSLFIVVAIFVRDLGLVWIYSWPAAWAIAALAGVPFSAPRVKRWLAGAFLLAPLAAPLLLATGYYALYAKAVPEPQSDLTGHMLASAQWDRNLVRLQRFRDGNVLVDIGNRWSFEMLEQAAQLEPLTQGLVGKGYLEPSGIVPPLRLYQYSDNALAVQIIWPFGRTGLVVMLIAFLIILLIFWRRTLADRSKEVLADEVGRLAMLTLFWSAAYMALANLNLAPFTGRNMYLLAARSMGDLLEGFVLLLLVVLPWVLQARESQADHGPEGKGG